MIDLGTNPDGSKREFEDLSTKQQDALIAAATQALIEFLGRDKFFVKLTLKEPELIHHN